ncbi:hypothetical protein [Pseudomonas aeruginosa]|nr:hypothetical protein [Pseudomonas aeruginosa]ETV05150.1 hypothetical protein Q051_00990 [Pseudomonas aeruginosa BWHPSA046]EZO99459.1 hypothetical protein V553_02719 [Pseudomonas aeruginosa BWH052]KSO38944.1 hypothetical protein APB05_21975 [Pseudomonas aeruginosa]MBG4560057.1 hypothetical protein [Pseudomonas aeruginosa]MBG6316866.1 hypothetical protein [Pseudomonas aeruginosa]
MEQAMREEFEAWWNLPAQSELRKSCARGWAEVIWQASRAALRVELPEPYAFHQEVQTVFLDRVKEALQQAGIEVK